MASSIFDMEPWKFFQTDDVEGFTKYLSCKSRSDIILLLYLISYEVINYKKCKLINEYVNKTIANTSVIELKNYSEILRLHPYHLLILFENDNKTHVRKALKTLRNNSTEKTKCLYLRLELDTIERDENIREKLLFYLFECISVDIYDKVCILSSGYTNITKIFLKFFIFETYNEDINLLIKSLNGKYFEDCIDEVLSRMKEPVDKGNIFNICSKYMFFEPLKYFGISNETNNNNEVLDINLLPYAALLFELEKLYNDKNYKTTQILNLLTLIDKDVIQFKIAPNSITSLIFTLCSDVLDLYQDITFCKEFLSQLSRINIYLNERKESFTLLKNIYYREYKQIINTIENQICEEKILVAEHEKKKSKNKKKSKAKDVKTVNHVLQTSVVPKLVEAKLTDDISDSKNFTKKGIFDLKIDRDHPYYNYYFYSKDDELKLKSDNKYSIKDSNTGKVLYLPKTRKGNKSYSIYKKLFTNIRKEDILHKFTFSIESNFHLFDYRKEVDETEFYTETRYYLDIEFDNKEYTLEIVVIRNICVHRFLRPKIV